MKCSVVRNSKNEIEQVLAPNGKESKLFNDIISITSNKEEALKLWAQVYTPQFKEWFGDWENPSRDLSSLDIKYPADVKFYKQKPEMFLNQVPNWYDNKNNSLGLIAIAKATNTSYEEFEQNYELLRKHYKSYKKYLESEGISDETEFFTEGGRKYFINKDGEKTPIKEEFGDESFFSEEFISATKEFVENREKNFRALNTYAAWNTSLKNLQEKIKSKLSVSKVVDENGEPLLVYHGSDAYGFSSFSKDLLGTNTNVASAKKGFFFATNKSASRKYLANKIYNELVESIDRNYSFRGDSGYSDVEEAAEMQFLQGYEEHVKAVEEEELMEDIFRISNAENAYALGDITKEKLDNDKEKVRSKYQIPTNIAKIKDKLITSYLDKVISFWERDEYGRPVNPMTGINVDRSSVQDLRRGVLHSVRQIYGLDKAVAAKLEESKALDELIYPVFISMKDPLIYNYNGNRKRTEKYAKIIEDARLEGKDGTMLLQTFDPEATDVIVPFEPNQIKSLFNQGNFSAANDNIYLQKGDSSPFEPSGKIQTIAQKLYNKFNISYKIVNNSLNPNKGWFDESGVTINLAHAKDDTAFHEYIHPFILVLEKQNPKLYADLIDQLSTDLEGLRIISEVDAKYSEMNQKAKTQEALVEYLGRLSEQKYNKPKSPFNRFIKWLKSLFKKIQIDFKDLSLNMTLSELSDIIIDDIYVADLRAMLQDTQILVSYQKPDTELTYATVYDRVKDKVAILNATIRNKKKGDQFKEDISQLHDIIQNQDEVTSINNFVSNSIYYIDAATKRFESLRNSVKNAKQLSKDEVSYNLNTLGEIQQLLNVYDSLNDIKSLLLREGVNTSDAETFNKLRDAIDKKDLIIEDFKSFALTYLTEWLFPYLEPTNKTLEAQGKKDLVLTKDQFREQLVTALRDISAAGYWLGTTINSRDPVSAAIGLALKDVVYDNHVKDLAIKKELTDEYEKARGTALYKSSKDEEAFNTEFVREALSWEQIGVDPDTGKPIFDYVKRLAFYQEYQMDQFDKAKREFYEQLGPKPVEPQALKAWKKAQNEWYNQNTQINSDFDIIIANKRKTLSKRQFEEWWLTNTKEVDEVQYGYGRKLSDYYGRRVLRGSHNLQKGTFRVLSGELIQPAEKYKDKKFPTLMKNAYYRKLYNTYKEANDKLGTYGLKYGIVPQLSKGGNIFSDLQWKDGVKENLKKIKNKAVNSIEADFDESRTVQRQDGSEVKKVPIYYTRMLNSGDLKLDFLEGVLKYSQMANNYSAMTEIEPNIIVLKTVLNGDFNLGIKGRDVAKTNSKGIQVFNAITKKVVPKMAREDMLNSRLNEFINDVVYGDAEFEQAVNIAGKEISMNKLSNKVALLTALQNMAFNVNGGISNIAVGNFNNSIEAIGRRFYSVKDWGWAQGTYAKELPTLIAETVGQGESFLNKLADHYDIPQGEFKDHYGDNVSKGQFNKLMKTSTLFFLQKGGEHQIQLTGMLSLMHSIKVKDASANGKEVSLYEAMKEVNNDPERMLHRYNWTIEDDKAFRNRLHAIVKNLHGVYNSFDKAMLSRRWYGKLALMFRKYLFKAITSRYGGKYVDYELGTDDGGYWREFMSKMLSDMKEYKWGAIQRLWSKEGYNDFQKAAVNKTLYEFAVIISVFVLIGIAGGDDDKDWLDAEMALQLTRFSADVTQYINPSDFIRVIRNPAASINMIEKWISWFTQLFHPTEEYQRAAGFAKAGDNKLYIKTLKLLPVVRQFINLLTPEEQIKFYKLTGR